jgi:hypothetical protein
VCGYREGQIVSGCFDRPEHIQSIEEESVRNLVLCNWILSEVTGAIRSDYDPIEDEELTILREGLYRIPESGETLKFSVPRDLDLGNIAMFTATAG